MDCPAVNQSSFLLIEGQLSRQCYSEDGCCYVTGNVHFLYNYSEIFCAFLQIDMEVI